MLKGAFLPMLFTTKKSTTKRIYQKEFPEAPVSGNKHVAYARFALVVVLLLILPLMLYLIFRPQDIRQRASQAPAAILTNPPAKTVARYNGKSITDKDVDAELKSTWGVYYNDYKNKKDLRDKALNALIERKILEDDAKKFDIEQPVSSNKNSDHEQDLTLAVSEEVLAWKKVETVSVFKDPLSPIFLQNQAKAKVSMERIRVYLSEGNSLKVAYDLAKAEPGFDAFIVYEPERTVYSNTRWGKKYLEAIRLTKKGSYTPVVISEGGSLMVAVVVDANTSDFSTLDQYIDAREKEAVKNP